MIYRDSKHLQYKVKEGKTDKTYRLMTVKEYIDKHHPGLSVPAIKYAVQEGKLDMAQFARDRFIIMNDNARSYQPKPYKNRS